VARRSRRIEDVDPEGSLLMSTRLSASGLGRGGLLRLAVAASATTLVGLTMPRPTAGQWPFNPAGYFYPKGDGETPISVDHVALLRRDGERFHMERPGLYAAGGRVYGFVSRVNDWVPERHKVVFEFETETVAGRSYRFAGEFHNSHVYEDFVKDPNEVVASGELRMYERGKLKQRAEVQWTYSAKPRSALSNANMPYPSGKTDLMLAVKGTDLPKVQALLAQGVDVNAITVAGETALTYAADRDLQSTELVRVLLAAGAAVNLGGKCCTPLTTAASKGDVNVLRLLLAAGADVNLGNGWSTPLINAAGHGDPALVELLLTAGANVNATGIRGFTALIYALQEIGAGRGSRESVQVLLRAGADVNAKDETGSTALSIARANHDDETVAILLQAGAKD
jgi:ankyrin repeat protein